MIATSVSCASGDLQGQYSRWLSTASKFSTVDTAAWSCRYSHSPNERKQYRHSMTSSVFLCQPHAASRRMFRSWSLVRPSNRKRLNSVSWTLGKAKTVGISCDLSSKLLYRVCMAEMVFNVFSKPSTRCIELSHPRFRQGQLAACAVMTSSPDKAIVNILGERQAILAIDSPLLLLISLCIPVLHIQINL
jgi:hypothetical protein